jgi:hypothetical protein
MPLQTWLIVANSASIGLELLEIGEIQKDVLFRDE